MQVLVEKIGERYRATAFVPFRETVEGDTRDEVLSALQAALRRRLPKGAELLELPVPDPQTPNPESQRHAWQRLEGYLANDPNFDEWQAAIQERRRQADADPETP